MIFLALVLLCPVLIFFKPNKSPFTGPCGPVWYCSRTRQPCSVLQYLMGISLFFWGETSSALPSSPQSQYAAPRSGLWFSTKVPVKGSVANDQLLSPADVQKEVVVLTPAGQALSTFDHYLWSLWDLRIKVIWLWLRSLTFSLWCTPARPPKSLKTRHKSHALFIYFAFRHFFPLFLLCKLCLTNEE